MRHNLHIDPEFAALIPPLRDSERDALAAALKREGRALEPVDVWRGLVIDGHNRLALCEELGIPYEIRNRSEEFASRAQVKAWMLDHQDARRQLTESQRIMLHVLNGTTPSFYVPNHLLERAHAAMNAGEADAIVAGNVTLARFKTSAELSAARAARAAHKRAAQAAARPPRGPQGKPHATPHIPEGHELYGVSTLTGPDGEVNAEWNKTRPAGADEPPVPIPDGYIPKRVATMQRGDGSTVVQWTTHEPDQKTRDDAMRAAWERHAKLYAGLSAPAPAPVHADAELITLYPLGDPHIGMLAWAPETGAHFDVAIACRELLATVRLLVSSAPVSERAIVVNLGDFLHAQDDAARTPGHGHALDVDGRFSKVLDAGHVLLRGIVDATLERHAHVSVRNLPGNHDPRVAAELACWLRAVYEREPRVTIEDPYAAHQYDRFGANLFGWHHGDRCKPSELPAIMATDRSEDWGATTERVWHCGHVHHLTRTETPGCVVETHRTMAGRDAWHAGRYRAGRSLSAITYHTVFGEIARHTVNLRRVQAAIAGVL